MVIFLAAFLCLAVFFAVRVYLNWALKWPRKMSFYGFKSRVKWTFKHHGWTCAELEIPPYPLMARKDDATLMFVCVHNSDSITPLKIADLDGNRKIAGLKQIICITADPVDQEFEFAAQEKRIFVMHYKSLKTFARLPSSNLKIIKGYFSKP